jgi:hypothetical protein
LALYLFLVTVSDGQGLSYYSDAGIGKLLPLDGPTLAQLPHPRCEIGSFLAFCGASDAVFVAENVGLCHGGANIVTNLLHICVDISVCSWLYSDYVHPNDHQEA